METSRQQILPEIPHQSLERAVSVGMIEVEFSSEYPEALVIISKHAVAMVFETSRNSKLRLDPGDRVLVKSPMFEVWTGPRKSIWKRLIDNDTIIFLDCQGSTSV